MCGERERCLCGEREMFVCLARERFLCGGRQNSLNISFLIFIIFFDATRSDLFLLMCSIAEKALEQLKMSLSKVKSGKTVEVDENIGFRQYPGPHTHTQASEYDDAINPARSSASSSQQQIKTTKNNKNY